MSKTFISDRSRFLPHVSAAAILATVGLAMCGCQKSETAQSAPAAQTPAPSSGPSASPPAAKPDAAPSTAQTPPTTPGAPAAPAAEPDKPKPIAHTSLAKDAKPINVFLTPTNVSVEEHRAGTGFPTLPKAVVTMHFELRVQSDWSLVQSTYQDGAPETRKLDLLVLGLADGLVGMRKGAMRRIIVPPTRGFGSEGAVDKDGKVVIPPDATLVFDVELIDIQQTLTDLKPKVEMPKGVRSPDPTLEPGK